MRIRGIIGTLLCLVGHRLDTPGVNVLPRLDDERPWRVLGARRGGVGARPVRAGVGSAASECSWIAPLATSTGTASYEWSTSRINGALFARLGRSARLSPT